MTLIKWTNKSSSLFDEIDTIFNNMNIDFPSIFNSESSWSPQFEVLNTDKAYIVRGDLPGISKKDVNIEVHDNILTVSGERKNDNTEENNSFDYSRISYGKFSRSFNLPEDVKYEKINAKMKDGVLSLEIPRMEAIKHDVKKISIK